MSNPISINWLSSIDNSGVIASKQTSSTTTGSLILNPNTKDPSGESIYEFDSVWRTVSLTSPDDNSAVTFVVTGIGTTTDGTTQTSNPWSIISESITGPNNDTVHSANIYKRILSITYSGGTTGISNVSAGFGSSGMTDIIFTNPNRLSWHASVQGQILNPSAIQYSVYRTLVSQEDYKGGLINYLPSFVTPIGTTTTFFNNRFIGIDYPVTGLYAYVSTNTGSSESFMFTALQVGV